MVPLIEWDINAPRAAQTADQTAPQPAWRELYHRHDATSLAFARRAEGKPGLQMVTTELFES